MPIPFLAADDSSPWFGPQASTYAGEVDWLYNFILAICAIFFVIIVGAAVWFVIRYRYRPGVHEEALPAPNHNTKLEIVWSVIPAFLVGLIFWYGFETYTTLKTVPTGALEIDVTAQQYAWDFAYPNGWSEGELHVPAGRDVRLVMTSVDVIHSLWIPDFRNKMDVVKGRYSELWFNAPEPGEHMIFCTEYCGENHSRMLAKLVVHPAPGPDGELETYSEWLARVSDIYGDDPDGTPKYTPAERGEILYAKKGCASCHAIEPGKVISAPSLGDIVMGDKRPLQNGEEVVYDENYLRESILDPQAKIAANNQGNQMASYQGRLSEQDIKSLIAFIKSLPEKN